MKEKKRHRLSVLTRIALLLSAAIILALGIAVAISEKTLMKNAANQAQEVARVAALGAFTTINTDENMHRLETDEEYRKEIHTLFRYICRGADIRYLYLYTVNEDESRRYLVCAAQDDEDDAILNEDYGHGELSRTPLHEAERIVLSGRAGEAHEYVDNEYGKVYMYVVPLYDDNKELRWLIGVDYSMESIVGIAHHNRRVQLILGMIVVLLASAMALILIRTLVVRPIKKLSKEMEDFAENKSVDYDRGIRKTFFDDEVTDIERSFDIMTADISKYINDIETLTGEKVQTETELEVAKNIQYGIVPKEHSFFGNGYDIFGCEHSAKDVGGDFYDIFELDESRICFLIGDVSGKGVSAALFMVMVKTSLREKLKAGRSLKATLMSLNRDMCLSNPENMFATIFAAVLDKNTGSVRYANAGHNPPVLIGKNPSLVSVKSGVALGLFDDIMIEEEELKLEEGEGILLYTDGITEAVNTVKDQYGEDRLLEKIRNEYDSTNARDLVTGIVDSVNEFAGDAGQFDDITCVAVFYQHHDSEFSLELGSFDSVKKTILCSLGESEKTKEIILACEEMFANIVFYSGADDVKFSCERKGNVYAVTFSDNGKPFDPVSQKLAEKDFEDLDMGGMGIRLARMNSDEMVYNRDNDRNVLILKFEI